MKNALRVIAVVVVAAILFGIGYGLGSQKGITVNLKVEGTGTGATVNTNTTPVAPTTTQPAPAPSENTTEVPAPTENENPTETPAPSGDNTDKPAPSEDNNDKPADEPAASTGIPSSTDEIVAKYNEVINAAKKTQNATIHKTNNTNIEVTELSADRLKGAVNKILSGLVKPIDETYTLTNGANENGTTASDIIAPGGRDVALKAEGVTSATATPDGDGYKMTIVLVSEKSTFDGTNTVNPVHHESCLSPLNLATLDISPAKITSADMSYPGATLNVTVDGEGRVTRYDYTLPMEGTGAGSLLGLTITLGLKGEMVETFDITY